MMPYQSDRWMTLRWQTDTRYYVAEVMQDLFGNWLLRRSWGGLRSARSQSMTVHADSYEHALQLLADVQKRRTQRGYRII